jgi:hypothetical protein
LDLNHHHLFIIVALTSLDNPPHSTMNIAGIIPLSEKATYLRTLPSIRERCNRVYDLATQGKLQYFDYHSEKEDVAVELCIDIIKVCSLPLSRHRVC